MENGEGESGGDGGGEECGGSNVEARTEENGGGNGGNIELGKGWDGFRFCKVLVIAT